MATVKKAASAIKKPVVQQAVDAGEGVIKESGKKVASAKTAPEIEKAKVAVPAPASKVHKNQAKETEMATPKEEIMTKKSKPAAKETATVDAPAKKVAEKKEPVKPVKIPKITSLGKVPYEPDFTHSVLDGPKGDAPITTPTQRYSDSDLAEFRELISRKLETARKELSYLQGLITRKDDSGGEGEDGRYMTMEDGTLSMEREQLSQMASRQITFIDHLEKAMIRIENKTYGICRETGKLIDKARLRAVPHATLSVEAKMKKSR
jgi:RNA polymerase-binding transcription factor DksA